MVALLVAVVAPAMPVAAGTEAGASPLRAISAGRFHTCAVLGSGAVKCWGINNAGDLGLGDTASRGDGPGEMGLSLPTVDLGTGRTATAIAVGDYHTCALLDDAQVKCWGYNLFGQIGTDDGSIAHGDDPDEMGDNLPEVDLGTGRTATAVTAGDGHSCALLDNGQVKCWGYNGRGELGLGDTNARGDGPNELGDNLPAVDLGTGRTATIIAGGAHFTCALLDNGQLKCWGYNHDGELGVGATDYRGDGPGEMGDNLPAVDLGTGRTATAISAGDGHSCAILDDGELKCWGWNASGQLGLGDISNRGDGPGEMGDNLPAVDLGTGRTPTAVSAGGHHTCAILDNGHLKCWGYNGWGELGVGDTNQRGDSSAAGHLMGDNLPAVDLGTGRGATMVTASQTDHTCAIVNQTRVKCWGYNADGQLGLGDTLHRGGGATDMGDNLPFVDLAANLTMTVTADVDATTHFSGDDITYSVTLDNPGDVDLTGVQLTGTAGLTCDPLADSLPSEAHASVDCTRALTLADVGTVAATFGATSDQLAPQSADELSVQVYPDRAPDGAIKRTGGSYTGAGIQNGDGTDQTVRVGRARGGSVTFLARFTNAGDTAGRFDVEPTESAAGLAVRYYEGLTDITRAVKDGTYRTARLAPGAAATIRMEVTVKPNARHLVDHDIVLRGSSHATAPQLDAVRARVHVN